MQNLSPSLFLMLLALLIAGCEPDDDDLLPITNAFRVLQVNVDGETVATGVRDILVTDAVELVFSHGIDQTALEGALSVTPDVDYSVSYDASGSILTLTWNAPLEYDTEYQISLPAGTYGGGGEASTSDFVFSFSTQPFSAPTLTLAVDRAAIFEGDSVVLNAIISFAIFSDVTFELNLSGSAVAEEDYSTGGQIFTIPAGSTSTEIVLRAIDDGLSEGAERITIGVSNLVNAVEAQPQVINLTLGDQLPAIALKGVLSLKIGGTATNGRAIHLTALEDIPDLSVYGIGIANNGGGSDGREIDLAGGAVSAGDDILLVRDVDRTGLADYLGDCFADFEVVVESDGLNFNGDDPFELFRDSTVIETYGDVEVAGGGLEWEYTGSWAYKLGGFWEYAPVDCSEGSTSTVDADCKYPFCVPFQLQGVLALEWDGSGTNGGKAIHLRANRDIEDISAYALGVANNGGGTDGPEIPLPAQSLAEGDHLLLAREPATLAAYFGGCFDQFEAVLQSEDVNQNGDDAIELFLGMEVVETYGDADVDGTGQAWEYSGGWAYRTNGVWETAAVNCAVGSTSSQSSDCPYGFCR